MYSWYFGYGRYFSMGKNHRTIEYPVLYRNQYRGVRLKQRYYLKRIAMLAGRRVPCLPSVFDLLSLFLTILYQRAMVIW